MSTGKPYLLRVEGTGVTVRLEGFDASTLPRLDGLAIEVSEADGRTPASYIIRVDGVVPSRAGTSPPDKPLRPFARYLRGDHEDRVALRGGSLRIAPGVREARLVLRTSSAQGTLPWQGEAVLTALQHALAFEGWLTLHAAAFVVDGVGVLAVGPSHAGKSTLCMAALAAGGRVVSDDWLAAGGQHPDGATVVPLRRDIWLREGSLEIVRGVLDRKPKAVGYRGEARWRLGRGEHPELFVESIRPDMVLHIRRDRRLSGLEVTPLTAAEGLARILNSTSPLFLSGRYREERTRLMPSLAGLINMARCHRVRMGRGLVEEPARAIRELMEVIRKHRR